MPMEKLQFEIHFVTHHFFPFYGWFGRMTEKEYDGYYSFKRGDECVVPNDDPYQLVAILDDHHQTLEQDILPAIRGIKKLFVASHLDSHDYYTKDVIRVHFVGFNPSSSVKEAIRLMMQLSIGLGFKYQFD